MEGGELVQIIKKDRFISQLWGGLYSQDNFPPEMVRGQLFIVNADNFDEKGSHWFVISTVRPKCVDFLCSYRSRLASMPNISKILKNSKLKIHQFGRRFQGSHSTSCGAFALFFCWSISRGINSPRAIENHFFNISHPDPYKFDMLVVTAIRHLLPVGKSLEKLVYDTDFIKIQEEEEKNNE